MGKFKMKNTKMISCIYPCGCIRQRKANGLIEYGKANFVYCGNKYCLNDPTGKYSKYSERNNQASVNSASKRGKKKVA